MTEPRGAGARRPAGDGRRPARLCADGPLPRPHGRIFRALLARSAAERGARLGVRPVRGQGLCPVRALLRLQLLHHHAPRPRTGRGFLGPVRLAARFAGRDRLAARPDLSRRHHRRARAIGPAAGAARPDQGQSPARRARHRSASCCPFRSSASSPGWTAPAGRTSRRISGPIPRSSITPMAASPTRSPPTFGPGRSRNGGSTSRAGGSCTFSACSCSG